MAGDQTFPSYNMAMAGVYPDASQWTNPYSNYTGGALPFPPSYAGTPTNAMGQPIQSYQAPQAPAQGTTLNSKPSGLNSTQQWWNNLSQPSLMNPSGNAALGMANWGAFMGPQAAIDQQSPGFLQPGMQGYQGQGGSQGGAQGATSTQPNVAPQAPNNWQNAISALANPGNPSAVGANYRQMDMNPMNAMGQGINNAALARFQQGGIGQTAQPGIGGGSSGINFGANNSFFNNLKGMQ